MPFFAFLIKIYYNIRAFKVNLIYLSKFTYEFFASGIIHMPYSFR